MNLSRLDNIPVTVLAILLYTPSTSLELFVRDRVMKRYSCTSDFSFKISGAKGIKEADKLRSIIPMGSDAWFFEMDLDKYKGVKQVNRLLDPEAPCVYFMTTTRFKTFKEAEQILDKRYTLSMTGYYLDKEDSQFLYKRVIGDFLSDDIKKQFLENYYSDAEAYFAIKARKDSNEEITTIKDLTNVCGLSKNSITDFTYGLIQSKINSKETIERNLRKYVSGELNEGKFEKARIKARQKILQNKYERYLDIRKMYSSVYIHTVVLSIVNGLIHTKMIAIQGGIYKQHIDEEEVAVYNEKEIAQTMRYWYKLKTIPFKELLILKQLLEENVWYSDVEFQLFIYEYMSEDLRQIA